MLASVLSPLAFFEELPACAQGRATAWLDRPKQHQSINTRTGLCRVSLFPDFIQLQTRHVEIDQVIAVATTKAGISTRGA